MKALGWGPAQSAALAELAEPDLVPGRVIVSHGDILRVRTQAGELRAELSGQLRHSAGHAADLPVVGDWVALRVQGEAARVWCVLPRSSRFSRKSAGKGSEEQVIAANVDDAFVVCGLDRDFNVRRLERYVLLVWESGARPVIVLSKRDICDAVDERTREAERVAPGVPVVAISSKTGEGLEGLARFIQPARTIALLGSSGAGKSTLLNQLAGRKLQRTREVRTSDGRGRHTTTARELFVLDNGALLIDTPGMRELQLWAGSGALRGTFEDIEALAADCAFRDCGHGQEPRCAVIGAVESGALSKDRHESYLKLKKELDWTEGRRDASAQQVEKRKWRTIHKQARRHKPRK